MRPPTGSTAHRPPPWHEDLRPVREGPPNSPVDFYRHHAGARGSPSPSTSAGGASSERLECRWSGNPKRDAWAENIRRMKGGTE